jgi:hypothetical protein
MGRKRRRAAGAGPPVSSSSKKTGPLKSLYPGISPLQEVLAPWVKAAAANDGVEPPRLAASGHGCDGDGEEEEEELRSLLQTTMVASVRHPGTHPGSMPLERASLEQHSSLEDVIERVLKALVGEDAPVENTLRMGIKICSNLGSSEGLHLSGMEGVHATCPHTLRNDVRSSPAWSRLHSLVGDDIMFYLLRWHSLFLRAAASSDCYLQLTGPSFAEVSQGGREGKEADQTGCTLGGVHARRLLYSSSFHARAGLPRRHALNEAKDVGGAAGAKILMTKIFGCPVGKRLRGGIPVFLELIRRHSRCMHARLLQKYCPLPAGFKAMRQIKAAGPAPRSHASLVDDEWETQPRDTSSLPFCDVADAEELPSGMELPATSAGNDEVRPAQCLPRDIAAMCVPNHFVERYIWVVLLALFPLELWGGRDNLRAVVAGLTRLAHLRQFDSLSIIDIFRRIKVGRITWLLTPGERAGAGGRCCPASLRARSALVSKLLLWSAEHLCLPLIRAHFYVTEMERAGLRLAYFRKPVWSLFRRSALFSMDGVHYRCRVADNEAEGEAQAALALPRSLLRLVPKPGGFRPLANLSRKGAFPPLRGSHNRQPQSANVALRDLFYVLRYEHCVHPELAGYGLSGMIDVFAVLKTFAQARRERLVDSSSKEPLYFVSCDIAKCFDSILTDRLLDIVRPSLRSDEYVLQRHAETYSHRAAKRFKTNWVAAARPVGDFANFRSRAEGCMRRRVKTVFTDLVQAKAVHRETLLQQLEAHLLDHEIDAAGAGSEGLLLQIRGIPQGSVLSSLLCNMYYGKFEQDQLSPLLSRSCKDGSSLLMRLVDDFLLVTADIRIANRFLAVMHDKEVTGPYGLALKPGKTMVNFEPTAGAAVTAIKITISDPFVWCGLGIHQETCSVSLDMARILSLPIRDTITSYGGGPKPGDSLVQRMKSFIGPRCNALVLDTELNTLDTVFSNIHDIMLLCALKTLSYLAGLPQGVEGNPLHVFRAIEETVTYSYRLMQSRTGGRPKGFGERVDRQAEIRSSFVPAVLARCSVTKDQTSWLGIHAFHSVFLGRLGGRSYPGIGSGLRSRLAALQNCAVWASAAQEAATKSFMRAQQLTKQFVHCV